jgi:hypothetical protein
MYKPFFCGLPLEIMDKKRHKRRKDYRKLFATFPAHNLSTTNLLHQYKSLLDFLNEKWKIKDLICIKSSKMSAELLSTA